MGNVSGPATNHDAYVPQWNGANSKLLLDGLPVATAATPSTLDERDGSGNVIATNTVAAGKTALATDGSGASLTGFTAPQIPATPISIAATTHTMTAPREYFFCNTATACSVTLPVPAAGYEFCIRSDNNVSTAITLAGRTNIYYELPARTGWGTVSAALVSKGAAVTNQVCVVGYDATHYAILSSTGF